MNKLAEIQFIKEKNAYFYLSKFNKQPSKSVMIFDKVSFISSEKTYTEDILMVSIKILNVPYTNYHDIWINSDPNGYTKLSEVKKMAISQLGDANMHRSPIPFTDVLNVLQNLPLFYGKTI